MRRLRQFGDCWLGCRLFEELRLDQYFSAHLANHRGPEDWAKVVELLTVNRLCAPGSELSVHERWFDRTAMDVLLEADPAIAGKDRFYPNPRQDRRPQRASGTTPGPTLGPPLKR